MLATIQYHLNDELISFERALALCDSTKQLFDATDEARKRGLGSTVVIKTTHRWEPELTVSLMGNSYHKVDNS